MVEAVNQEKIQRYRRLVQSLADLGHSHAKAIQTKRHQLTYFYFVRCAGLVSGVVLLVENEQLSAAFALQKSVVDAVINGLYLGYAADDTEFDRLVAMTIKGKETGSVHKRAAKLDAALCKRKKFMSGQFAELVKQTEEYVNEFAHGGVLSTSLDVIEHPPQVAYKVLADCTLLMINFLGNVYILENIDLSPLKALMEEFQQARVN
ncbi:MAG: DUF6988 family protein [Candidatus Sulfotelmatobacter sp.]